jgi:hypothetical protein
VARRDTDDLTADAEADPTREDAAEAMEDAAESDGIGSCFFWRATRWCELADAGGRRIRMKGVWEAVI